MHHAKSYTDSLDIPKTNRMEETLEYLQMWFFSFKYNTAKYWAVTRKQYFW